MSTITNTNQLSDKFNNTIKQETQKEDNPFKDNPIPKQNGAKPIMNKETSRTIACLGLRNNEYKY